MIQFGEQEAGVVIARPVGISAGYAGGQVVRFVDDEQRLGGIEAGLIEKETTIIRSEHVVEIADPYIVKRERSAGDFIRTNARVGSGGAQCHEVMRLFFVEVEFRQSALRPAFGAAREIIAAITHAVKSVVDAVLGFIADLPEGQRTRVT